MNGGRLRGPAAIRAQGREGRDRGRQRDREDSLQVGRRPRRAGTTPATTARAPSRYALHGGGLLDSAARVRRLRPLGRPRHGRWITIYANAEPRLHDRGRHALRHERPLAHRLALDDGAGALRRLRGHTPPGSEAYAAQVGRHAQVPAASSAREPRTGGHAASLRDRGPSGVVVCTPPRGEDRRHAREVVPVGAGARHAESPDRRAAARPDCEDAHDVAAVARCGSTLMVGPAARTTSAVARSATAVPMSRSVLTLPP